MEFQYKGLKARLDHYTVTDEDVERQLQRMVQQNPRIASVEDRPTQLGDEIVLDYAGFVDDEQFQGGTAENQTLVLGSGSFIPGFEEQLLDKVPGEKVTVKVTFPTEYHAENLAGKEAEFYCTVRQIRISTRYELDDVFAQEVTGCESLEQLRAEAKQTMQQVADEQGEMDLQEQLLRQAADTLEPEISEEALEKAVDERMNVLKAQLSQQGLTLEMYCSFLSTTEEQLRQDARPEAITAIRVRAAVDKIVALEKLEVTPQDIDEAIELVARENNKTLEELKPYLSDEFEKAVAQSVLVRKATDVIRRHAVIEE